MISVLFIMKCFHWLLADRVDYVSLITATSTVCILLTQMERSPLITWAFHLRAVCLILLLAGLDYLFMRSAWRSISTRGLSVEIVFGLEVGGVT